jgi:hypothetical protein
MSNSSADLGHIDYVFYIPGCKEVTTLSEEDWLFLCRCAKDNNTTPAIFAARLLTNELAQWRDSIHFAEEFDSIAIHQEKQVEEELSS